MPSIVPDPAQPSLPNRISARTLVIAGAFLVVATLATSQTIGSPNTVTADPPIPHPKTTPCTVPLFSDVAFADFTPKSYTYTPACAGPWSKVILIATFQINAGRQFDRTANIWLGGVNIYFGTTAEPSHDVSRTWHIQRDLTDYSALLTNPQAGEVDLGNLVNSTYTSVLHGSAFLQFYPPDASNPAPITADLVLPMSSGPTGETVALNTTTDQLAATFTLPTTVERAYLDVLAQSQSNDEFWYACVPNDVAAELFSCGNTGFRESEVTIDGQPAGVAPVYPWIYTGGIDPYLWRPIPGVQTMNFLPYRVNLTPFASLLDDGQPHTVALSVFNADSYFSATASLLLYLDSNSTQFTGALTENTLAVPAPNVAENIHTAQNGNIQGTVNTRSGHNFQISGYINTATGPVTTTVAQNINFANLQYFKIQPAIYEQSINQTTTIHSVVTTHNAGGTFTDLVHDSWPLKLNITLLFNPDGSGTQATTIDQYYERDDETRHNGQATSFSLIQNRVTPTDTLDFDASFNITGNQNQTSAQNYFSSNSTGYCYSRSITANTGVLTSITDGQGCN